MNDFPIALVTGAAHRLGKTFAVTLAKHGYAVLLHYHRSDIDAKETAKEICDLGVPAYLVQADLTNTPDLKSLLSYLDSLPHQLKIIINSASIMQKTDFRDISEVDWDTTFAINLRAPFLLAQYAAGRIKEGGLIVNIVDVGAYKLWTRYPAYVVSKSALDTLTKLMAKAFAPAIRVNAIAPGLVLRSHEISKDKWEVLIKKLPLKKSVSMEEISHALVYLMDNPSVTGQSLIVDGGYSLI